VSQEEKIIKRIITNLEHDREFIAECTRSFSGNEIKREFEEIYPELIYDGFKGQGNNLIKIFYLERKEKLILKIISKSEDEGIMIAEYSRLFSFLELKNEFKKKFPNQACRGFKVLGNNRVKIFYEEDK
jgi:hypothetical protein